MASQTYGWWDVTGFSEAEYKGKRNGRYWSPRFKRVTVVASTSEEAIEAAKKEIPGDLHAEFKATFKSRKAD